MLKYAKRKWQHYLYTQICILLYNILFFNLKKKPVLNNVTGHKKIIISNYKWLKQFLKMLNKSIFYKYKNTIYKI